MSTAVRHLAAALSLLVVGACTPAPRDTGRTRGPGPMRVVAGDGTEGFVDGSGRDARFRKPIRLAALGPDSVVVADVFNHAIREVGLDGRVRTIVGGPDRRGWRDGPAQHAQLNSPHGVAVLPDGAIAVAEAGNHTIRLLTPGPRADGPAAAARFRSPHAVVVDRDGSRERGSEAGGRTSSTSRRPCSSTPATSGSPISTTTGSPPCRCPEPSDRERRTTSHLTFFSPSP